jgi:hypothetical protein
MVSAWRGTAFIAEARCISLFSLRLQYPNSLQSMHQQENALSCPSATFTILPFQCRQQSPW